MIDSIQQFVASTDPIWQWLTIMAVSAVPFIESYFGSALGVMAGVAPFVAILAAVLGNWLSMFVFVTLGHRLHGLRTIEEKTLSPKRQKLKNAYLKYGVAGVSLFGQTLLPSQITSMAMVTFGAPKHIVIFWQTISIILWGVVCGTFAAFGVQFF